MATSEHFTDEELSCKCGCGENLMEPEFLEALESLRLDQGGFPMVVTSGYRCPWYNSQVSKTGVNGPHTTGKAVDIAIGYEPAFNLVKTALDLEFTGIGIQQRGTPEFRFIHLDTLEDNRPRLWSY